MEQEMALLVKTNENTELKKVSLEKVQTFAESDRVHELQMVNKELLQTVKQQQQLINHLLNINIRRSETLINDEYLPALTELKKVEDEKVAEVQPKEQQKIEFSEVYSRYCHLPLKKKIRKPTVKGQVLLLCKIYSAGNEIEFSEARTLWAEVTNYRYAKKLTELNLIRIFYRDKKYYYSITETGKLFVEGVKSVSGDTK